MTRPCVAEDGYPPLPAGVGAAAAVREALDEAGYRLDLLADEVRVDHDDATHAEQERIIAAYRHAADVARAVGAGRVTPPDDEETQR